MLEGCWNEMLGGMLEWMLEEWGKDDEGDAEKDLAEDGKLHLSSALSLLSVPCEVSIATHLYGNYGSAYSGPLCSLPQLGTSCSCTGL